MPIFDFIALIRMTFVQESTLFTKYLLSAEIKPANLRLYKRLEFRGQGVYTWENLYFFDVIHILTVLI